MTTRPQSITVAPIRTAKAPPEIVAIGQTSLNPAEAGADDNEDHIESQNPSGDRCRLLHGGAVVDIECRGEERKVADEPKDPWEFALPERPFPGEHTAVIQEAFDDYGKCGQNNTVNDTVVDSEDLCFGILRKHETAGDTHDQKHERDFDVIADHQ